MEHVIPRTALTETLFSQLYEKKVALSIWIKELKNRDAAELQRETC